MRVCVFAGTFDPITNGHEYVVNKCLEAFDKVVIAVGVNVDKNPCFTTDERVEMIKRSFKGEDRIEVDTFEGMLVDFMKKRNIKFNVRGLRDVDDYKYETTMARYNLDMYPEIITLYIPTPTNLTYVSSSAVRNILSLKGDFAPYMPKGAAEYVKEIRKGK